MRDVTQIPWDFYFDISEWPIRSACASTPALMLHQTNPCAKRKVLSLTKSKGKMYKTKSLGNYITLVARFASLGQSCTSHETDSQKGKKGRKTYSDDFLLNKRCEPSQKSFCELSLKYINCMQGSVILLLQPVTWSPTEKIEIKLLLSSCSN